MAMAHAMGPVWEANHVWLIFVIVLPFTASPPPSPPLSIGLFGRLFTSSWRGSCPARGGLRCFRGPRGGGRCRGDSSFFTGGTAPVWPALLLSHSAAGHGDRGCLRGHPPRPRRRPGAGRRCHLPGWGPDPPCSSEPSRSWPLCAYLAAVTVTVETSGELREDFRQCALLAGTAVVALSGLAAIALPLSGNAPFVERTPQPPGSAGPRRGGGGRPALGPVPRGHFRLGRRGRPSCR